MSSLFCGSSAVFSSPALSGTSVTPTLVSGETDVVADEDSAEVLASNSDVTDTDSEVFGNAFFITAVLDLIPSLSDWLSSPDLVDGSSVIECDLTGVINSPRVNLDLRTLRTPTTSEPG